MDAERKPIGDEEVGARDQRPVRVVLCDGCGGTGVGQAHLRDAEDPSSEYRDPCRVCQGAGKRPAHRFNLRVQGERGERWVGIDPELLERRWDAGSYVELDRALELLRGHWPGGYRALFDATAPPERRQAAIAFLVERMPGVVRVPADVVKAFKTTRERRTRAHGRGAGMILRQQRDREVRQLVLRDKRPTSWVAAEYGLSVPTVNRIVAGGTFGEDAA